MMNKKILAVLSVVISVVGFSGAPQAQILHLENNYNLTRAAKAVKESNYEDARKYLRRATKDSLSDGQLSAALTDLCGIDYVLGKLETAEKACNRAVRVDRKNWRTYFNRGAVLLALGKKGAAEADYQKANTLRPNDVRIQRVLAAVTKSDAKQFAENR